MGEKLKSLFDELGIGREKLENFNRMELNEILEKIHCGVYGNDIVNEENGEIFEVGYNELCNEFYGEGD